MKNLIFALTVCGVVALPSAGVWAQWSQPAPPPGAKPVLTARVEEMKTVLTLTDEQVTKITDLIAETEKQKKTLDTDFTPVKADYDKALAANDQAALKAAIEKWTDLYKSQADINTKANANIDSVLTAEQLDQWREHKFLKPTLSRYEKLGLSADQMSKIRAEFKRCMADVKSDDPMFQYQLQGKLGKVIEKEILTDDQRQKFVLDPTLAAYKATDLTDDQKAKIKDQLVTLIKGMGPDDTMSVVSGKLYSFIQKDVVTVEQRGKQILNTNLASYKSVELTDEQVSKIKDQLATLLKAAKPDDSMGNYAVSMKLNSFIQKDVLTDAQREKMMLDPMLAGYKKAELTDEQIAKIKDKFKEIMKEAKPDDMPWQVAFKLSPFISKEVLTDDQRTKMGIKPAK